MSESPTATLFLIPNCIGDTSIDRALPPYTKTIVAGLQHFLVEEEKSARRLIKQLAPERNIRELSIERLNEHTKPEELDVLIRPLREGHSVGVISEAGCPAIADPGADVVRKAHELGITVVPLIGPCSIVLALMASGLHGQTWRFQGYIPVERDQRANTIRMLDERARTLNETQIIMETPYRNDALLHDLLTQCDSSTQLCVAQGITTAAESIHSASVKKWREQPPTLAKIPSLFLLGKR